MWAIDDPDGVLDLDEHLGPIDAELAAWEGYHHEVATTMELELGSNWKCALEAFQETYHFPYVHGNSMVGQGSMPNITTFDQLGRHHVLGVPTMVMGAEPEPAPGREPRLHLLHLSVHRHRDVGAGRRDAAVLSRPDAGEEHCPPHRPDPPLTRRPRRRRAVRDLRAADPGRRPRRGAPVLERPARVSPRVSPTSCSAATRSVPSCAPSDPRRPGPRHRFDRGSEPHPSTRSTCMAVTDAHAPTAVHIGADELPFVEIGGGNLLKVIQVERRGPLDRREHLPGGLRGPDPPPHRAGVRLHGIGRVEVQGVRLRQPRRLVPLRAGRFGAHAHVHRGRHPGVVPDVRRQPQPRRGRQRRVGHRRRRHARLLPLAVRGGGLPRPDVLVG